jgi:Domain of unknown function (DUF4159)
MIARTATLLGVRPAFILAALAIVVSLASGAEPSPQRGGRFGRTAIDGTWFYDGSFVFCRIAFRQAPYGDGGGWDVDYPRADLNLPFRTGQLTKVPISRDPRGEPNHVLLTLTDPHLFQCPFIMMTEPGGLYLSEEEATRLREYLDKGGFLWADDFWGEYAWSVFENEIRKALPAEIFPIVDLPPQHPLFHMLYEVKTLPQIPSITFWFSSGYQTSERIDSRVPHARAINNANGHVMVLITHNTDFGDAFEREGDDRRYFDRFATEGYAFGINVILYAMTH